MAYPKPLKNHALIKMITTIASVIIVMMFAPRMNGPRIIGGVEFNTKTGGNGLTNFGWILLILAPIITFLITSIILNLCKKKKD